jgi:hypothetical protein
MKELLLKRENELDALADEIVDLVANSKKLTDILKVSQENEIIQKKNLSEMVILKNKITDLEYRLNKLIKSFRIDIVEAERLITEKYEDIRKENEKQINNLQDQIEEIKAVLSKMKK